MHEHLLSFELMKENWKIFEFRHPNILMSSRKLFPNRLGFFNTLNFLTGLECSNYTVNSEEDRSVSFPRGQSTYKCDRGGALVPGWYRFNGTAGFEIPSSCVAKSMCNTDATGWLNGTHPTLEEGVVSRTVCFHWSSNCCNWSVTIQVRNCGLFFVYKLVDPGKCHLRYCVTK